MIAPCPFDMMVANLFEMMMALSSKWWIGRLFEMTMVISSKWWMNCHFEMIDDTLFERLMAFPSIWRWRSLREERIWGPLFTFEMTVISLIIEERCCVRSCLLSKGQIISKSDRTFLAMIVYFEGIVSRQKLSKSYHLSKIDNFVRLFALISYLKENHRFKGKISDNQQSCPANDMCSTPIGKCYIIIFND